MKSITITLTTNDDSIDLVDLVKSQYEGSKVINSYTIENVQDNIKPSNEEVFKILDSYLKKNPEKNNIKDLSTMLRSKLTIGSFTAIKFIDDWIDNATSGVTWANGRVVVEEETSNISRETIFSTLNKYLEENQNSMSEGELVYNLVKDFNLSLEDSLKTVYSWVESTPGLSWKEEWDNLGNLIYSVERKQS